MRVLAFLMLLCLSSWAYGQEYEDTGESAYGYTSLIFDTQTNQLTAYSETDLDPDLQGYYEAFLKLSLKGPSGALASGTSQDLTGSGTTSLTLTATGQANSTYTATGTHYGIMEQTIYDPSGQTFYDDAFSMYWWELQGVADPLGMFEFFAPGSQYSYPRQRDPNINLGSTTDSGTIQTASTCGDVRSQIIGEYYTNGLSYHPSCSDFTQSVPAASPYSFATLNQGYFPTWAILQSTFLSGLQSFIAKYGSAPTVISGYRDPYKEQAVDQQKGARYTRNSRHSYGDAVDFRTSSVQSTFTAIRSAGLAAGACAEPQNVSTLDHVHLDWRQISTMYKMACSSAWLK